MSKSTDKQRPFSSSGSSSGIELTPRQQSDQDLLDQSGMGGFFFTVGAVALSMAEPLIWQRPLVAIVFLSLLGVMMTIRLYLYFTLPSMTGFVLPGIYYVCLLGNAMVWGIYAAWIVSLPAELNASGAITITLSAGAACGGSVAMAMDLRLARALMMLYIMPLVAYALWHYSHPQLLTLGLLLIIFLVYLYTLSTKQYLAYWKMANNAEKLRKQTQELAEARNEALKANQMRSDFLAHISHEIRTPINGIIGVAGDLVVSPLDDGQQDQVNVILQSGKLALGLINDVMDFSDINHDSVLMGLVDVDLLDVGNDRAATALN
jgi:signal transduction histidine kinase